MVGDLQKTFEHFLLFKYYKAILHYYMEDYKECNFEYMDIVSYIAECPMETNLIKYIEIRNSILGLRKAKNDSLLNSLIEDNTQFKAKKQKYYDTKDYYVEIFDALKADYNLSKTPIEEKMYYLSLLDIQEILGNNMYQFYMLNISMFNSYKAYIIEIKVLSQLILSSYCFILC